MTCEKVHAEFGAYVLGGLSEHERREVDTHLLECPVGAAELSELEELPELLDRLTVADLATAGLRPSPEVFDRTVAQLERHRHRRRVASAVAMVSGLAAAALVGATVARPHPAHTPTFSASAGGVTMRVGLHDQPGGTALAVTVDGLPENEHCRLLAVSRAGTTESIGSWSASYHGSARVTEASSFAASQISSVRLVVGDGTTLVAVPL